MGITYTNWNPSDKSADITLSNADLTILMGGSSWGSIRSLLGVTSGKWYWEITVDVGTGLYHSAIGVGLSSATLVNYVGHIGSYGYRGNNGKKYNEGSSLAYGGIYGTGDIIGIALDLDGGKIWWSKNGAWQAGGNPATGTGEAYSGLSGTFYAMCALNNINDAMTANFGDSAFSYSAPSGFFSGLYESEDEVIDLTEPFSLVASIQSDIEITIPHAQLSAETSMSVGSIFEGVLVNCPSPLTGTSSLQSEAKISIPSVFLTAQSEMQGDVQINIPSVILTSTSLMSVGEILQVYIVDCPLPFLAQANMQSTPQIEVNQSLFTSTGSLYVQPEIQLFAESLLATGSISAIITDPFSVAILPRVYTFTLTGTADGVDDIVIPIKSFQSRLKSSDPTYLSVVIPGTDYASEINLRLNGDLVVRMGYLSNSEIILSEIISIVDFENIIIYDGTTNKTITLDGHRTETFVPKEINLTGSSYKNITAGKLRYRCTPNLYVRPGDTVNIDDDSFTIENITYSVSPELETFEVSE